MKRGLYLFLFLIPPAVYTQTVTNRLAQAIKQLEADPQMKHALVSLYVADAKTGKPVYTHHEQIGLAAASTQKIFTSVAAFELLGGAFRYKTELGYEGNIKEGVLQGDLDIISSGDPTLGSWRWKETDHSNIIRDWVTDLQKAGITKAIKGAINVRDSGFSYQAIPDGWIWQDMGNYYGAGAYAFNWIENQYDLMLQAGNSAGDPVKIISIRPESMNLLFTNELKTAAKGSGDNAYIYFALGNRSPLLTGTVPVGEKPFSISGAMPNPAAVFTDELMDALEKKPVLLIPADPSTGLHEKINTSPVIKTISTYWSPSFDSINYYFLKRSVNLYGEALIKTMAFQKTGYGSTDKGVELVRDFWSQRGIDKGAVNIVDGSGLSPQNRVTTEAEVKVLQYAKTRPWFNSFYSALPEFNGMKIKSGSIGGARAFTGYHTAKSGKEYVFSIIVNNYDGSSGEMVKKLYKVLDVLK